MQLANLEPTINAKQAKGISSRHKGGANVLMADGSVQFLMTDTLPARVQDMLAPPPEEANKPTVQTYAEDYQGLFQRVSTTAKRCFASKAGLYRSGAVDADLYSEIGYGQ